MNKKKKWLKKLQKEAIIFWNEINFISEIDHYRFRALSHPISPRPFMNILKLRPGIVVHRVKCSWREIAQIIGIHLHWEKIAMNSLSKI